jgi:putative membrane protein
MSIRSRSERPGLQGERSELAWERSALGLLAVAGLLLFRTVGAPPLGHLLLAVADVTLALVLIWLGRRRGREIRALRSGPDGRRTVRAPGREVLVGGVAAMVLAAVTAVLIPT